MQEFERRGVGEVRGLYVHGFDEVAEAVECAACPVPTWSVYRISYDGKAAKFTVCRACFYALKQRWGGVVHEVPAPAPEPVGRVPSV